MTKPADMIVERRIDRPQISWSQYLHEIETKAPLAGKQIVSVNLRTLMGGFCRFHGSEAQNAACAWFKGIHERAQLGGARAVDLSIEAVDGRGVNPEAIFEIGADARKSYNAVVKLLGKRDLERIEFVVVHERGPTRYAKWRRFEDNGRGRGRASVEVRAIADKLAVHRKLQGT